MGTWSQVLISAAGPGAGFLLAIILWASLRFAGVEILWYRSYGIPCFFANTKWDLANEFFYDLAMISILWGIVNLMPILPLDGGHIARELLTAVNPAQGVRQSLILSLLIGTLLTTLAIISWHDAFLAIFFGSLAYASFAELSGRAW